MTSLIGTCLVELRRKTASETVLEALLELTCIAHDMVPFARDIGRVDEDGVGLPRYRGRLSPCYVSKAPSVAKFIRLPSSGR